MPGKERSSFAKSLSWTVTSLDSGKCAAIPIRQTHGRKTALPRRTIRPPASLELDGPMRTVYLDYNATTPLDPVVREAMLPFLDEVWGNPSSVHHVGRRARAILDDAGDRVGG